jgi:hypothetical protein
MHPIVLGAIGSQRGDRALVQRIGRGGGAQRVRADLEAERQSIAANQLVDAIRREGLIKPARAIIADGSKGRAVPVGGMTGFVEACSRPRRTVE